jgi:hypothetical protein
MARLIEVTAGDSPHFDNCSGSRYRKKRGFPRAPPMFQNNIRLTQVDWETSCWGCRWRAPTQSIVVLLVSVSSVPQRSRAREVAPNSWQLQLFFTRVMNWRLKFPAQLKLLG